MPSLRQKETIVSPAPAPRQTLLWGVIAGEKFLNNKKPSAYRKGEKPAHKAKIALGKKPLLYIIN